jgi:hypothetical protein
LFNRSQANELGGLLTLLSKSVGEGGIGEEFRAGQACVALVARLMGLVFEPVGVGAGDCVFVR